jgi:hypothetical protein
MLIHKTPSKTYSRFTISEKLRHDIARIAKLSEHSGGKYWIRRAALGELGVAPLHVTENFKNVAVVEDPSDYNRWPVPDEDFKSE